MAYTRSVIRVSDQALRFHGVRSSSNPSLLLGSASVSKCFWRILGAGNHSLSGNPKSNSNGEQDSGMVLRPGMVLLKGFLTEQEQVTMIHKCENVRAGIFPGTYCHHRIWRWDPQKWKYGEARRDDDSRPPFKMPHEFLAGIIRAITAAQSLTRRQLKVTPGFVKDILPMMSPDTCEIQFQHPEDRHPPTLRQEDYETYESLANGLPVVEFSLGDSADFFYGDCRDSYSGKKKVVLESGDVLIFGGLSRLIFHSVGSVFPGTAPKYWLDNSGVLPGRFSLSFREF